MTDTEIRKSGRRALVGMRPMTRIGRAVEKGETQGFMKIAVDADSKEILGAAILGTGGDEAVHCILDMMYAKAPYTLMQRAMYIHPTVSELIPTLLGELPLRKPGRAWPIESAILGWVYSSLMPASRTTRVHFARSSLTKRAVSSGELSSVSAPRRANASRVVFVRSVLMRAACTLSTMSGGVAAGNMMPVVVLASKPRSPDSSSVGTAGRVRASSWSPRARAAGRPVCIRWKTRADRRADRLARPSDRPARVRCPCRGHE